MIDLPKNFVLRLTNQVQRFTVFAKNAIAALSSGNPASLWQGSDDKFDKVYGLEKVMIAITERGTILGLTTTDGSILWERVLGDEWEPESIFKSKRHHDAREAVIYLKSKTSKSSKLLHLDPLDGSLHGSIDFDYVPTKIIKLTFGKQTAFLLVKNNESVDVHPAQLKEKIEFTAFVNQAHIYWTQKKEITGYQINNYKLVPVWNFVLPESEEIYKVASWNYDNDESFFTQIIPEEGKVIFKFVDSNNFAILTRTSQSQSQINLYILNGVTGRVLASSTQSNVDFSHPVNLVYDENSVFVTYFNSDKLYYEFWVTEFYKNQIESSFTLLLEKYFSGQVIHDEEEQYNYLETQFFTFTKKFYFQPGVKALSVVQTKRGITKKNLIVITNNDQIYSLDRGLLSTRRQTVPEGKTPVTDPTSYLSAELLPYHPILPINTMKYITYHLKFCGIQHIVSSPTQFESTALVVAFGHDLVFSRYAPEKEFDMLNEDFNYLYLFASILVAFVATVVIKRLELSSRLTKIFQ